MPASEDYMTARHSYKSRFGLALLAALVLGTTAPVASAFASDDAAARKILQTVSDRNSAGFQTGQSKTKITLTLADGRSKTWTTLARVGRKNNHLRTRVTFLEPADNVGTELLILEQGGGEAQQYLWLPKTKRLRRIGGSQRSEPFMGTDFSFADLEGRGLRTGEATKLGQETVGGVACTRIAVQIPGADEVYGKIELWIDEKAAVPRKLAFFDRAGKHVKTMQVDAVRDLGGGRSLLEKFRMLNHLRNSVTTVETRDVDQNAVLPDALFSPDALGR
jgi:hypothetical protein